MLQAEDRVKVISRVKAIVVRHHFNIGNVNYDAWSKDLDEQTPALITKDDDTFEDGVRNLLSQLKSSHTNFYRLDTNPTMPQHSIGATLRQASRDGAPCWMFLDVFEEGPAACAGINPGDLLINVDGAPSAPPGFPVFRFGQKHLVEIGVPARREARSVVVTVPSRRGKAGRPPLVEPKSISHGVLQNTGVLKISFFSGAFGIQFSRLLDSAVESLKAQYCDRLIIDLRGCIGGSLGFAHLVSYLCPDRVPIGHDVTRKRRNRGYDVAQLPRLPMPDTKLQLLYCLARFSLQDKSLVLLTQGLGKQPFHGRVVVLVNEWTNSAGEIAAQFAQDTKLATVVGKQTKGNILGSTTFNVSHGYKLYLPVFGWYGPRGTCAEGSGIQPDVTIDIDPDRLAWGEDAQINKALELLR